MTTEIITRAPAGGITGLNGIYYDGGEFLPLSARGGNRGAVARAEIAKREASNADAAAIASAECARRVAKEVERRSTLKGLISVILREVENESRSDGFWHNTAARLHLFYREWKQWDGVTCVMMESSWQTGKLSEKWAGRIARTDAEFQALVSDV
jgi:hypothetical protein